MFENLLLDGRHGGIGKGNCLIRFVLIAIAVLPLSARNVVAEENSYLHSVTIEQGVHQGSINCFGCSVVVKGDLDGEIVTIGGDVTVFGRARRDIVAVGGEIHLKNGAEADAGVVAIGGGILTEAVVTARGKDAFGAFTCMHWPVPL